MTASQRNNPTCSVGHSRAKYGIYKNGQCRECKRIYNADKARRAGGWTNAKRGGYIPRGMPCAEVTIAENLRTNRILHLVDKKTRALSKWDRDDIQKEIERVKSASLEDFQVEVG